jgi:hypothetical protein
MRIISFHNEPETIYIIAVFRGSARRENLPIVTHCVALRSVISNTLKTAFVFDEGREP